ncbi:MAG: S-adenosylmethionine:tRNA ribosyltransferase-isomerase, partial [Acidimicrobiia bacterium]
MGAAPTYELPASAIAQEPAEPRDSARLLVDGGPGREPRHRRVRDLPCLLRPGDVVVVNDSKVLPARLRLTKATGGAVEVLLLEEREVSGDEHRWDALVRPGRRVPPGTVLVAGPDLTVEVGEAVGGDGTRTVRLTAADLPAALDRHGELPLPPYLHGPPSDPDRYQTVYARRPGSVAAPTAGLHLTRSVLDGCRAA